MCDLICDVISLAVFQAAIRVKSTQTQKKRKFLHKAPSKRLFRNRIHRAC